jgi:5-methylcytosine-specific restriction endonuclease McrA
VSDARSRSAALVPPSDLSNRDLLAETARAVSAERTATAHLVALLAEVDDRQLYLGEGYPSMFVYCTQALHLSESAAYDRIEAARVSRRLPVVLERLIDGALTLTAVRLLAPHLTNDNCDALLDAAQHKSKRDVLEIVARLAPQPDSAPVVRRLPAGRLPGSGASALVPSSEPDAHAPAAAAPAARPLHRTSATVAPVTSERYVIKVTVSREAYDNLRRAQDLLRHALPDGDPAAIVERALRRLVDELERRRLAKARAPRSVITAVANTRRVPANVRRLVWERDGGQCAFIGAQGRCGETGFLEFHHLVPYAAGGPTSVENLALRCRAHNAYESVQHYGPTRAGTSWARAPARRTT